MTAHDLKTGLDQAFKETLEPVRQHLATIESEIAAKEDELTELRKLRTLARKIVGLADPASAPAKRDGRPKAPRPLVSPDTLDRLREYLRDHYREQDPITTREVLERPDFDLMSIAHLRNGFAQLHESGALRLDHVGHRGERVYRLTKEVL